MRKHCFLLLSVLAVGVLAVRLSAQDGRKELADKSELQLHLKNALDNPVENPKLPRVLLIGDSISLGYTVPVRKLLEGKANVHRVPDNARNTSYGLKKLDGWLGEKHWDVIHFNWGLWDICYRNPEAKTQGHRDKVNGTITVTPEEYRKTLEKIVMKLKKSKAKLIWCSTTPVPEEEIGRIKGDEVKYNLIAAKIMKENNIAIDDLYAYLLPKHNEFQLKKGNVHFTPEGYSWIAKKVSMEIEKALASVASTPSSGSKNGYPMVVDEIREEAVKPTIGPKGRALPLFSAWHMQCYKGDKFNPEYQITLIKQGKHILPWNRFHEWNLKSPTWKENYEKPFKLYAKWHIPLTLSGQNFEYFLQMSRFGKWADSPPDENPGVITQDGKISHRLSPFASPKSWYEMGRAQIENPEMAALQRYYPDPPRVILLNNNEAEKLAWNKVETDKRYTDKYGKGKSESFKKRVVSEGWMKCYSAMKKGILDGFSLPAWRKNTLLVGYNAFSEDHLGRWNGWSEYSLYTTSERQVAYITGTYDGASSEWYDNQWEPKKRDYRAWSVQTEMMNLVFMQKRVYEKNPNYWFELSVWEGDRRFEKKVVGKPEMYRKDGEKWSADRYAGSVQFGLWLLRPRALRIYIERRYSRNAYQKEFDALLQTVENVYNSAVLMRFWRWGKLVPNRARKHFFNKNVPPEYAKEDRWFLLDCDMHPKWPWSVSPPTDVDVFPIALVMGKKGKREWLVYVHSPRGDKKGVVVTIPEFGDVTMDSTVDGSFYLLKEIDRSVRTIAPGAVSVWRPSTQPAP